MFRITTRKKKNKNNTRLAGWNVEFDIKRAPYFLIKNNSFSKKIISNTRVIGNVRCKTNEKNINILQCTRVLRYHTRNRPSLNVLIPAYEKTLHSFSGANVSKNLPRLLIG